MAGHGVHDLLRWWILHGAGFCRVSLPAHFLCQVRRMLPYLRDYHTLQVGTSKVQPWQAAMYHVMRVIWRAHAIGRGMLTLHAIGRGMLTLHAAAQYRDRHPDDDMYEDEDELVLQLLAVLAANQGLQLVKLPCALPLCTEAHACQFCPSSQQPDLPLQATCGGSSSVAAEMTTIGRPCAATRCGWSASAAASTRSRCGNCTASVTATWRQRCPRCRTSRCCCTAAALEGALRDSLVSNIKFNR